jgi:hypothetical protein
MIHIKQQAAERTRNSHRDARQREQVIQSVAAGQRRFNDLSEFFPETLLSIHADWLSAQEILAETIHA